MPETTATQRVRTVLFYGFLAILAWMVFLVLEPFLTPLVWAAVLVILFYPWHQRLERHWRPTQSALVSTVVVTTILIVPALFVMTGFVHQALGTLADIEVGGFAGHIDRLNRMWTWLAIHLHGGPAIDLTSLARNTAERATTMLAGELGGVVRQFLLFLFDLLIAIIAMFYFFRDAGSIMAWLRRLLPFGAAQRERMIDEAHDLVFVTVASSLAGAGLAGLVGGLAFFVVGIHRVIFWGVVTAFSSLLPFVGSWIIWVPAAMWLLAEGHPGRAIALLAICSVTVAGIDYVLRPAMIGRMRMNGLLVLIGVLGGIAVFGLIGLVLGPVILATATSMLRTYTLPAASHGSSEGATSPVIE
ncbi:MAG TPA: AI-2E family transporter [Candidatus Acidoferrales bacterium]|nr:AI-2E family transporter [Candidatus Acidoferrales bacterium]